MRRRCLVRKALQFAIRPGSGPKEVPYSAVDQRSADDDNLFSVAAALHDRGPIEFRAAVVRGATIDRARRSMAAPRCELFLAPGVFAY
jgi:hypothetical protein